MSSLRTPTATPEDHGRKCACSGLPRGPFVIESRSCVGVLALSISLFLAGSGCSPGTGGATGEGGTSAAGGASEDSGGAIGSGAGRSATGGSSGGGGGIAASGGSWAADGGLDAGRSALAGTCDIFGAGNTPCVAAHSTVRLLASTYSGPLYQVRRASDSKTQDHLHHFGHLRPIGKK